MMNTRRYLLAAAVGAAVFLLLWLVWPARPKAGSLMGDGDTSLYEPIPQDAGGAADSDVTMVYAHNLELRKGPNFRIYVRWLRGEMVPVIKGRTPSLDDQQSFVFHIDRGLVHANLGDIDTYLNAALAPHSPLKSMTLRGQGSELKLTGMLHKLLVPMPVEVDGTLSPATQRACALQGDKDRSAQDAGEGAAGQLQGGHR
ncbi:MAG: hypothetical protein PW789_09675 [Edaphobacter sp.]|uniref:hypothetical protein n=1 Tax=Edaphobacter sp. TaxID=1934404 RepID=UPI0023989E4F|nr:hypothetical protein [Edaphobacter sp.]MDE1176863.1 hypothetical protein [Edaphobacter sp.]